MEREYIVVLKKDVDYNAFWNEIENLSSKDGFVPSRRVDIINERPGSLRSCHYSLTDNEAEILRNDPRIYGVEIPPNQREDIKIELFTRQTGDYSKSTADAGNLMDWAKPRVCLENNPYVDDSIPESYPYTLDGTGVDIVVQDSGLEVLHPEFLDRSGNSRVQMIDWYAESGLPGAQNANHYRDYHGHGTHVAGTIAGINYGWAKNARIYSVKVNGLEGTGDGDTGISTTDCFDVIKLWHRNKPIDPVTGVKRPTIVNMSWGYGIYHTSLSSVNYRGTTTSLNALTTTEIAEQFGIRPRFIGTFLSYNIYRLNSRIASIDADVEELIDEGVIVCIAAGNYYHKIDVPGGADYDNYVSGTYFGTPNTYYYQRGSSPYSTRALITGNVDSVLQSGGLERKNASSECGPGVTLYSPGTDIISASSTINEIGGVNYHLNSNFKQARISGTSMATPQVAGVAALYLQLNPEKTPEEVKEYLVSNAKENKLYTTNDTDYANDESLMGGENKYLFNRFNSAIQLSIGQ